MKFVLPGVPPGAQPSAFMPHFNRLAASGAQQYKGSVSGQPGTQAIPAPVTDTTPAPGALQLALAGTAKSSDAPPAWYPSEYYDGSLNGYGTMGPVTPVRIYSDNMMPVPAKDPRGRPAMLSRPPRYAGQRQVAQPRATPTWGS